MRILWIDLVVRHVKLACLKLADNLSNREIQVALKAKRCADLPVIKSLGARLRGHDEVTS